jgi:hypothetical protein
MAPAIVVVVVVTPLMSWGVAVGDRVGQVDDERAELRAQPQAARSEEHDEQGLGMAPGEQARAQRDIRAGQEQAAGGRCERPRRGGSRRTIWPAAPNAATHETSVSPDSSALRPSPCWR